MSHYHQLSKLFNKKSYTSCLWLSVAITLIFSLPFSMSFFSLSPSLCVFLSFSPSLSLSHSRTLCLYFSLSHSMSVSLCICISGILYLSHCLSLCPSFSRSQTNSHTLCLCLCLSPQLSACFKWSNSCLLMESILPIIKSRRSTLTRLIHPIPPVASTIRSTLIRSSVNPSIDISSPAAAAATTEHLYRRSIID